MEMVVINGIRYRPEAVPKEHRDAIEAQKKASPQGKTRTASTKTAAKDKAGQKAEGDGEGGDS